LCDAEEGEFQYFPVASLNIYNNYFLMLSGTAGNTNLLLH